MTAQTLSPLWRKQKSWKLWRLLLSRSYLKYRLRLTRRAASLISLRHTVCRWQESPLKGDKNPAFLLSASRFAWLSAALLAPSQLSLCGRFAPTLGSACRPLRPPWQLSSLLRVPPPVSEKLGAPGWMGTGLPPLAGSMTAKQSKKCYESELKNRDHITWDHLFKGPVLCKNHLFSSKWFLHNVSLACQWTL